MNVSSSGSSQAASIKATPVSKEAAEPAGAPDHDGDSDDTGVKAAPQAALPQGVGKTVNKTA